MTGSETPKVQRRQQRSMPEVHPDQAGCEALWHAVIATAVSDAAFERIMAGVTAPKKHEQHRLRLIRANPVDEFLEGPWFRDICAGLRVDPDAILRRVREAAA